MAAMDELRMPTSSESRFVAFVARVRRNRITQTSGLSSVSLYREPRVAASPEKPTCSTVCPTHAATL